MGNRPAIVVNEVKNTGLNLKIALLKAKDFVVEPGLFLLRRLKVSIKTIVVNHYACQCDATYSCLQGAK